MPRDHWNDVEVQDEEALIKECVDIIWAADAVAPLTYPEFQELRIAQELCDRGHFKRAMQVLADKAGRKLPYDLDVILEDPDFDVRTSFMKAVLEATDTAPCNRPPAVNPNRK